MKIRKTVFLMPFILLLSSMIFCQENNNGYKRVVSLGPNVTESLYLLGAQDKLVADTVYCIRPPEAQQKEKVGTLIDVNIEKVMSLKPDLILAVSLTRPDQILKMKKMGLNVKVFPGFKNFEELCANFLEVGNLVDKKKEAYKIIEDAGKDVNHIKAKTKDLVKPKVFIQIGAKPLFTVTGRSFINDFLEYAGGVNIAKNANSGLYSREEVIRSNPDVIIIVLMGIEASQEKKTWENYIALNAVKNKRIYSVDAYKVCSPTPVNFKEALFEITEFLHPGLLKNGRKVE